LLVRESDLHLVFRRFRFYTLSLCCSLVNLDVSGSAVTSEGVRILLGLSEVPPLGSVTAERQVAAALSTLGLSSCRGVSREIRAAATSGIQALYREFDRSS
jgi:hypothetical protein